MKLPQTDLRSGLWSRGYSRLGQVLSKLECEELRACYDKPDSFRKTIHMARYRFGRGEYKYFEYPIPAIVDELRQELYARLSEIANEWMTALSLDGDFPPDLSMFLERCRNKGQNRPTPLLLHYVEGDFNCMHQDLYGDVVFPFQVVFCLSEPEARVHGR